MGFWKNVDDELKFQGMERKVLASLANFDVSYIGKGIRRNSVPAADLAVRIAKVLNVSLEYLLEMPEQSVSHKNESTSESNSAIRLYHKYSKHLNELENLSTEERDIILKLMNTISSAHKAIKN